MINLGTSEEYRLKLEEYEPFSVKNLFVLYNKKY